MDPLDRELLEFRLADDPTLRAEVAALAAERRDLLARRARVATDARRQRGYRWAGLAALLALAVVGSWWVQRNERAPVQMAAGPTRPLAVTPAAAGPRASGTSAQLEDGSFENGRIAATDPTGSRIDFENGTLAGLDTLR
jgi:hypothetical protein